MNTTADITTAEDAADTVARTPRVPKAVKAFAALVLLVTGVIGSSAAISSSASAATAMTGCFKWSTGAAYASQPLYLQQWNGSKWATIRNGKTNASGCGTFSNTPSNVYLRLDAYVAFGDANVGMALFDGPSTYFTPGTGTGNVGTVTVRRVQCVQGRYGYCAGLGNFA